MALKNKLAMIDKLHQQVQKTPFANEKHKKELKDKFEIEWSYNSNHLEGNTLTYEGTRLLLLKGLATGDHEKREYDEMEAHHIAVGAITQWAKEKDRELTEADIRDLNKIILVKPFWKEAETPDGQKTRKQIQIGEYKQLPNSVRLPNGEMFEYASPEETPQLMKELMDWYKDSQDEHPLVLAAELHYRFICIHPFDDGNGRVARLLVNYVLVGAGYPPLIVKTEDKKGYLNALRKADAGNFEAFAEYMADQLVWSLEMELKARKGKSLQEPGDLQKRLSLLKRNLKGSDKDQEVRIEKTKKAIENVIKTSITRLFDAALKTFNEFDDLFKSREVNIWASGTSGSSDDINRHWEFVYNKLDRDKKLDGMALQYRLQGFRAAGTKTFNVSARIDVKFDQFVYEAIIPNKDFKIDKLYHQVLTNEEVITIAEAAGAGMLEDIETRLKKLNK